MNQLSTLFSKIKIDYSWSFSDKTRKDTAYITHGYHRYPAKFIPQIVSRLAEKYTKEGDLIVDPFGGCGTTLVESKVIGRPSVGVDVNPVAVLITKVKTTPIEAQKIEKAFITLEAKLSIYSKDTKVKAPEHERIDYWFKPEEKRKLAFIFAEISKLEDQDVRDFFYCGFSNILKRRQHIGYIFDEFNDNISAAYFGCHFDAYCCNILKLYGCNCCVLVFVVFSD